MGLRRKFWQSFFGLPHGAIGRVGVRLMTRISRRFSAAMAAELELQPDDELLDVGCGSAGLLTDHARQASFVAGVDVSELQLSMARDGLAERIRAGTAQIALADATALLAEGGTLYFSNNRKGFRLDREVESFCEAREITAETVDPDFQRRPSVHRCWSITC